MADGTSGQVPVIESVGEGYSYLARNWTRWLPAAMLLGLLYGLISIASPQSVSPQADGTLTLQALLLQALLSFSALVISTGIYRHALLDEFVSPVGFTISAPELRVLGVTVGLTLVFAIIAFFVIFILAVIFGGAAAQMGLDLENADQESLELAFLQVMQSGGGIVFTCAVLIALAVMIFVAVRLSFVQAATVAEGRMMAFSTWSLTKGNWWRVLQCILFVVIPVTMVSGIATTVLELAFAGGSTIQRYLLGQGLGLLTVVAQIPMVGLFAYLYKGLRPRETVDEVFD